MNEIEKREEALHNWVIFHVGDGFDMTSEKRAAFRDGFDAGIAALEAERDALRADAARWRVACEKWKVKRIEVSPGVEISKRSGYPFSALESQADAAIVAKEPNRE